VHTHTTAYVTLGSASLKWLKVWTPRSPPHKGSRPSNLDFYQAHYYPWMDGQSSPTTPTTAPSSSRRTSRPTSLGLDRPLVIGELIISDTPASASTSC
jgi:hypothetical protein